jgi:hypothetical protein
MRPFALALACLVIAPVAASRQQASVQVQAGQATATPLNELDRFMEQVLARRDDNWKKLQQYILDEQERFELRGPGGALLLGEKREYTWYVREGYFIRSPVRFNGITVSDRDRDEYEERFLKRARERDARGASGADAAPIEVQTPSDVQGLLRQSREPQFISSSYFLRFKFDPGRYALVGREQFDGKPVLRIEYSPTKLFSDDPGDKVERRQKQAAGHESDEAYGAAVQRVINKTSLVTMWIEQDRQQIVKYTFDNVGFEVLPLSWLVRMTDLKASMMMKESFPGIWLPSRVDAAGSMVLAPGRFDVSYSVDYSGYREAAVTTKVRPVR